MIYIIKFKSEPLKFINKQSKPQKIRILKAINNLPNGDIKRLINIKNQILYRLRVGNYRIIYSLENNTITILNANNRGDIYKNI